MLALALTPAAAAHVRPAPHGGPARQLAHHVAAPRDDRSVVRFFESHDWILSDPRFSRAAMREYTPHRLQLVSARWSAAALRSRLRPRAPRGLALQSVRTPQAAICRVFGSFCVEALQVARCESRLRTWARNGEYLGLFQMGSAARALFGHGSTAFEQALAAHRYFVFSGRDWSPWNCKPW